MSRRGDSAGAAPGKRSSGTKPDESDQDWIAQRKYVWRPQTGRPRTVTVQIAAPRPSRQSWASQLRISGLSTDLDHSIHGIDSIQALELALSAAGKLLSGSQEYRAGQIELWSKPIKYDTHLFLPLPMQSLQLTLDGLRHYLGRKQGRPQGKMLRNLLAIMREISMDLATLAAHLPITPRKRLNRTSLARGATD
jgi:hypothetical protein